MSALDDGVFAAFRHFRNEHPQWRALFEAGWYFGEFGWLALIALLWVIAYWLPRSLRRSTTWLSVYAVLCLFVGEVARRLLDFPRPSDAPDFLGAGGTGDSFPSRPVYFTALTVTVLWAFQARLTTPLWLRLCWYLLGGALLAWVTLAQLYFTLNFFSDIAAGLVAGIALGVLCAQFSQR
jgi:hypothetical protein